VEDLDVEDGGDAERYKGPGQVEPDGPGTGGPLTIEPPRQAG